MYHLRILSIGKTKEQWLDQAFEEYVKRLQPVATVEAAWAKNNDQLMSFVAKELARKSAIICLDASGQMMDSPQFCTLLLKELTIGGAHLALVIGGPEGLPPDLKHTHRHRLLSLSPMTFTHQVVRLILIEQIYRAFEIAKGSRYHK